MTYTNFHAHHLGYYTQSHVSVSLGSVRHLHNNFAKSSFKFWRTCPPKKRLFTMGCGENIYIQPRWERLTIINQEFYLARLKNFFIWIFNLLTTKLYYKTVLYIIFHLGALIFKPGFHWCTIAEFKEYAFPYCVRLVDLGDVISRFWLFPNTAQLINYTGISWWR